MSVLSLQNICFSYGKNTVLNDISYEFEKGKMYCIIGKSGAGKTTLLSLLSGLAAPNSGEIIYDGKNIAKIDKYTFRSKYIGVVFQSFNLITKYTALENVILSMDVAGYKTKNMKARALSYDPDIILADEPTGNLDRETQKEIMEIFRELANQGKCVILVSHSPEVAAMCDERYELTRIQGKKKKNN